MGRRKGQKDKTTPRPKESKTSTPKDRGLRRILLHKGWLTAGGILTLLATVHFHTCIAERKEAVNAFKESAVALSAAREKHLQSFTACADRQFFFRAYLQQHAPSRSEVERGLNEVVACERGAFADCNDYKLALYKHDERKYTVDRLFRFKEARAPVDEKQCEVFASATAKLSSLDVEELTNDPAFRSLVIFALRDEAGYLRLKTKLSVIQQLSPEAKRKTEEVIKTCEQRTSSLLLNIWDCCKIF